MAGKDTGWAHSHLKTAMSQQTDAVCGENTNNVRQLVSGNKMIIPKE